MTRTRRFALALLALLSLTALGGCGTIEGIGNDLATLSRSTRNGFAEQPERTWTRHPQTSVFE